MSGDDMPEAWTKLDAAGLDLVEKTMAETMAAKRLELNEWLDRLEAEQRAGLAKLRAQLAGGHLHYRDDE